MAFDYEEWLKAAQDRLEALYQQKTTIENEISLLERGIKGFAPLVNQPSLWYGPEAGITEAVRAVLKSDPSRLYLATQIRDELLSRGVQLTQQNPMATIHQVLARLVNKGTAKIYPLEPGRNHYQWSGNAEDVAEGTKRRHRRNRRKTPTITTEELVKMAAKQKEE
jgi:hypothetical protein